MSDARTVLEAVAGERSRYQITAVVKNLAGEIVTPSSLKWTLTDSDGAVRNDRSQVVVPSPTASHPIILYGADLATSGTGKEETRICTVEASYTEGAITGMPYNHEYIFTLRNFVALPIAGSTTATIQGETATIQGETATIQGA